MQRVISFVAVLCLACAPLTALAAAPAKPAAPNKAVGPHSLGGAQGWNAYSAGEKSKLVCYIVGHPTKSLPAKIKRGRVEMSITQRPGDKSFDVVEFALGYTAKPGSEAELEIDGKKYPPLFTNKESAWNRDAAGDRTVTRALEKGKIATIKAVSDHGTATTDTYSLDGLSAVLALTDKACNVKH